MPARLCLALASTLCVACLTPSHSFAQGKGKHWVRTQRFKLYSDGRLFDVANDPREKNIIDAQSQSAEAAKARAQLQAVLENLNSELVFSLPSDSSFRLKPMPR